ncbi:hypothetical protein ACKFKF_15145 [Phormidesmis sp. 146-12]
MLLRSGHRMRFFTIAGLMISAIVVLGIINQSASVEIGWREAAHNAPPELMQQVVEENLSSDFKGDSGRMKVLQIQRSGQSKPLFLIDSRIANEANQSAGNPLCGASGCQFFGYVSTQNNRYQRVLAAYFNPRLPPKIQLFDITHRLQNGLPVLTVNQLEDKQIRQFIFAFNGKFYELVETQLLPKVYE